jgi:aspartyl protease family protein
MKEQEDSKKIRRMGLGMQVLAWLTFLGLGMFYFGDLLEKQHNPNQSLETRHTTEGMAEVVLQRNRQGHYVTSGEINGKPVTFILDTGATGVAVPSAVAKRLGLQPGRAFSTQTANGQSVSYAVNLEQVGVGGITLQQVSASITPGLMTREVLLGMSFLKHIEFTQRGDQLILRQLP